MKTLHTLFFLLCSALLAFGNADVTFTLSDFTVASTTNRTIWITPISVVTTSGSSIVIGDRYITNSGAGTFTVLNMVPSLYEVTVKAPPMNTTWRILVNTNTTGSVQAATLISTDQDATYPFGSVAYSAAASDTRYLPIPTNWSSRTDGQVPSVTGGNTKLITASGGGATFDRNTKTTVIALDRMNFGPTLYVATNGSDSNSGWTNTLPLLTISNAIAHATNGVTIFIGPGTNSLGTNLVILPIGVNLKGSGTNLTFIKGYADCSGVENALAATGGPQINPGDNCRIEDFTIFFDTNGAAAFWDLPTFANATHSGTWSGIGTSWLNAPSSRNSTNVHISRIMCLNSYFDAWHCNSDGYCEWTFKDCIGESQSTVANFQSASPTTAGNASYMRFVNCHFITSTNAGLASANLAHNDFYSFFGHVFVNTDKKVILENCVMVNPCTTAGSGFSTASSSGQDPYIYLYGGVVTNLSSSDAGGFSQSRVFGYCNYMGSNVWKLIGDVAATTNANATTLFGSGTVPSARLSNIPNASLANSAITINGTSVSLGGTITTGGGATFDVTQFAPATAGTNIRSGAIVTNLTIRGDANATNALYVEKGGVTITNGLGAVSVSSGTITTSSGIQLTNLNGVIGGQQSGITNYWGSGGNGLTFWTAHGGIVGTILAGDNPSIAWGTGNFVSDGAVGDAQTVSGGVQNGITNAFGAVVAGGGQNIISNKCAYSTISGGNKNLIGANGAIVGIIPGGISNMVSASGASVIGNFGTNSVANSTLITGSTAIGTNGPIHSTNVFQVASTDNRKVLEVNQTVGKIFANVPMTAQGVFTNNGVTTLNSGVFKDGGGFKHARVAVSSINSGADALTTVTWSTATGTAFADANYTVTATVQDSTSNWALQVIHIESISATAVTVRITNQDSSPHTGTLHIIAIHD